VSDRAPKLAGRLAVDAADPWPIAGLAALAGSAGSVAEEPRERVGEVVLVGAGPGDPELLTVRALRELQAADAIVYDRLVTPEILELGRRDARRIHVGKEGHGAACRQEDISALLVDLALAGERVVRLKGGDPSIFGRSGEEIAACREAGVLVRVVPGITSASAAAASLGVSLTHRDHAQRLQFVTGHDRHGTLPDDLDFTALADARSTVVVYMGRRTAARLAERLIAEGLPSATPAVAISDVSRPQGSVVRTNVGGLLDEIELPRGRPMLILIGRSLDAMSEATARIAERTIKAAK
jgi:uroporphyrin-III C-methyltransferase / precorrin-2 dehydrogenase / sirohydrochlorin ferrochelatase